MRPTQDLMTEHRAIERTLAVLDAISGRLEAGEATNAEHLEQILEFIRVFADRCHHAKEEDLLFVAMREAGVPSEGGPIAVMLADHEAGRGHVRGMAEGLAAYRRGRRAPAGASPSTPAATRDCCASTSSRRTASSTRWPTASSPRSGSTSWRRGSRPSSAKWWARAGTRRSTGCWRSWRGCIWGGGRRRGVPHQANWPPPRDL